LTSSPRSAVFWFVAEPGAEPKPSRMAGYFSEIPLDLDLLPDRYFNLPLYKDEIWPNVQAAFDFVGFRDEAYFPSGDVSCRPDGAASYLIDPALNTKAFLDVISAQTGTSLALAKVTLKEQRAPGRVRFIFETLEEVSGVRGIIMCDDAVLSSQDGVIRFPKKIFDRVRRAIRRGHDAALEFANEDKVAYLRSELFPPLLPAEKITGDYRRSVSELRDTVSDAINSPGKPRLKHATEAAAARTVRRAAREIAKESPAELYQFVRTIELVTFEDLIAKFEAKLSEKLSEEHWQQFLLGKPHRSFRTTIATCCAYAHRYRCEAPRWRHASSRPMPTAKSSVRTWEEAAPE
jgi:hypothetical protein